MLTARLKLHPRAGRDFLDALVALGMLEREGNQYANTPETDFFLDPAKPSYIGGMLEMANASLFGSRNDLTDSSAHRPAAERGEDGPTASRSTPLYGDPAQLRNFLQGP